MKSILITGANGFLGRHIVKDLVLQGYKLDSLGIREDNDIQCDLSVEVPKNKKTYQSDTHQG